MTNKSLLAKIFYVFFAISIAHNALSYDSDDNVFLVENVNIYAESDDLDNAKREAMNNGTKAALRSLLERLLPMENYWKIDNIDISNAADTVKSTQIIFERMTSTSYRATIDFVFDEKLVKRILNRLGIYYIDQYSPQTLVIPVLHDGKSYDIWENTAWYEAWGEMPVRLGLMRFNYTIGDLTDTQLLNPQKIFTSKLGDNDAILKKYESEDLVLVLASTEKTKLNVSIRFITKEKDKTKQLSFPINSSVNEQEFYKTIAMQILEASDSFYKRYDDFAE